MTDLLPPRRWPGDLRETVVFNGGRAEQRWGYLIEEAILDLCAWGHQWPGAEFSNAENQGRRVAVGSSVTLYLELPPFSVALDVYYQAESFQTGGTEGISSIRFQWGQADVTQQLVGRNVASDISRDLIRWRVAHLGEVAPTADVGSASTNLGGGAMTISCPAGTPTGFQLFHVKVLAARAEFLRFTPVTTMQGLYQNRGADHIWAFEEGAEWEDTGDSATLVPDLTISGSMAWEATTVPGCLGMADTNNSDTSQADFNLTGVTDMGFDADRTWVIVCTSNETGSPTADGFYILDDDQAFGTGRGNLFSLVAASGTPGGFPYRCNRTGLTPSGADSGAKIVSFDDTAAGQTVYIAFSYDQSTTTYTMWYRVGSGAKSSTSNTLTTGGSSSGEELSIGRFTGSRDSANCQVHFMAVLGREITEAEVDADLALVFG